MCEADIQGVSKLYRENVSKERRWRHFTKVRECADINGNEEKKKGKHKLQRISRGRRFRRRWPHPLLKSTHKTPEWEQQPVQRPRRCHRVLLTRPTVRLFFIWLSLSFLAASRKSSCINCSRLCRSHRHRRTVLRPLGATGASIRGPGRGAMSNMFMQGRTVTCRTQTEGL